LAFPVAARIFPQALRKKAKQTAREWNVKTTKSVFSLKFNNMYCLKAVL